MEARWQPACLSQRRTRRPPAMQVSGRRPVFLRSRHLRNRLPDSPKRQRERPPGAGVSRWPEGLAAARRLPVTARPRRVRSRSALVRGWPNRRSRESRPDPRQFLRGPPSEVGETETKAKAAARAESAGTLRQVERRRQLPRWFSGSHPRRPTSAADLPRPASAESSRATPFRHHRRHVLRQAPAPRPVGASESRQGSPRPTCRKFSRPFRAGSQTRFPVDVFSRCSCSMSARTKG